MSSVSGARNFYEWIEALVLAFFGVGAGGLFEVVIITIAAQSPPAIICTQWIKPDVEVVVSAQMPFDHLRS